MVEFINFRRFIAIVAFISSVWPFFEVHVAHIRLNHIDLSGRDSCRDLFVNMTMQVVIVSLRNNSFGGRLSVEGATEIAVLMAFMAVILLDSMSTVAVIDFSGRDSCRDLFVNETMRVVIIDLRNNCFRGRLFVK